MFVYILRIVYKVQNQNATNQINRSCVRANLTLLLWFWQMRSQASHILIYIAGFTCFTFTKLSCFIRTLPKRSNIPLNQRLLPKDLDNDVPTIAKFRWSHICPFKYRCLRLNAPTFNEMAFSQSTLYWSLDYWLWISY